MKRFSKNDNQAICNYCGKWQPTDLTNQQLEEMDWKCDECKAKEGTPEVEPTPQERGSKEISKYDPEYTFLVKLVKLLVQEGVSPQEIKSIADAYPFVTVDDVGDLTAKLWTLATTKYQIPRDWLIKRLPKNASLKKQAEVLEVDGFRVYVNPTPKELEALFTKSTMKELRYLVDSGHNIFVWDSFNLEHNAVSRELSVDVAQQGSIENLADVASISLNKSIDRFASLKTAGQVATLYGTKVFTNPNTDQIAYALKASKNNLRYLLGKDGSVYIWDAYHAVHQEMGEALGLSDETVQDAGYITDLSQAEDVMNKRQKLPAAASLKTADRDQGTLPEHFCDACGHDNYKHDKDKWCRRCKKPCKPFSKKAYRWRGQEEADDMLNHAPGYLAYGYGQDKTSDFTGAEFSRNDVGVNPTMDNGPFSSPEDHGAKPQKQPFPNTNWLPADDENKDEQPANNVAASLDKEAFLDHAYWIDPKGEVFQVRGAEDNQSDYAHIDWITDNQKTLEKNYGIHGANDTHDLIDRGWVRIGDSRTDNWQVEVADLKKVPSSIDLVLAQFASENAVVDFADLNDNFIQIVWPWNNVQQAINRAMRMQSAKAARLKRPFSKKASTLDNDSLEDAVELYLQDTVDYWDVTTPEHADMFDQLYNQVKNLDEARLESQYPHIWNNYLDMVDFNDTPGTVLHNDEINLDDIPVLDKNEKMNQLLEQLHAVQNPTQKQKILEQIKRLRTASLSKKAKLPGKFWIAPDGKEFPLGGVHGGWITQNLKILKRYGIDYKGKSLLAIWNEMMDSGWARISDEPAGTRFTIEVGDLNHLPSYLDDFVAKYYTQGQTITIGNGRGEYADVTDPFPTLQKAIRKRAALSPQAYWVDPKGVWYTVRGKGLEEMTHSSWARDNFEMLQEKYPELNVQKGADLYRILLQNGWTRIGDSWNATYQIQTYNPSRLHSSIIDWIYQNVPNGSDIEVEDAKNNQMVTLEMPVQNVEKEITQGFRKQPPVAASLKFADLSGRTVNEIEQLLQTNGGVTFNMSKGNMVGTDNYAVAIYPERSQIIPSATFEHIEDFILTNEDLLNDPKNSFGAWSHDGKVYMDVVATVPDINQAVELGKQHNQIAIWDLKNAQQISTGGTGEVKQASQNKLLPQQLQDAIAAEASPIYNVALNNYAEAVKRGHEKDRSLKYALESVSNLGPIDPKKFVELVNKYL